MDRTIALPTQVKNLQAGNVAVAWAAQSLVLRPSQFWVWALGVALLWCVYHWFRQFSLRRRYGFSAIRTLGQVWSAAKDQRFGSYVLLLPVVCFALMLLAYLPFGTTALPVSVACCLLLCVLVILAERYPLAAYA